MEKLICREIEHQKLTKYMQSERGEFIAIYGRRRVSNTCLQTKINEGNKKNKG